MSVTTTANFTQPGVDAGAVIVTVTSTAAYSVGITVHVDGGGYYTVDSIVDGTNFGLINNGDPGNAPFGELVFSGATVTIPSWGAVPPVIYQTFQERDQIGLESPGAELYFQAKGTEDAGKVASLVGTILPATHQGYLFSHYTMEHEGGGVWSIVLYFRAQTQQAFSGDTLGGTQKVKQSLLTTAYGARQVTTTNANYTQPAVNSNVSITFASTASLIASQTYYIVGGGNYTCASITNGTVAVFTNLGTGDPATVGATVVSGASVNKPAPDFSGAINVGTTGDVDGVDVTIPVFQFSITRHLVLGNTSISPPTITSITSAAGGSLTALSTYWYAVTSTSTGIESPATEQSVTIAAGQGSAVINYTAPADPTGVTGYKIYRGTTPGGEATLVATITGSSSGSYTDSGGAGTPGSPPASVGGSYLQNLYAQTGKTNNATFTVTLLPGYRLTFAAEECKFDGASFAQRGASTLATLEVCLKFSAVKTQTVIIGNVTFTKIGWRYVWVSYARGVSNGRPIQTPVAIYQEKVYPTGDFSTLGVS